MAAELTLLDLEAWESVSLRELVDKAWTRKASAQEKSPHVLGLVESFNRRSYWVAGSVLQAEDMTQMGETLSNMMRTALLLRKKRNFFAACAFVTGIGMSPLKRLQLAWDKVPGKVLKRFLALDKEVSGQLNSVVYREEIRRQPGIPHLVKFLVSLLSWCLLYACFRNLTIVVLSPYIFFITFFLHHDDVFSWNFGPFVSIFPCFPPCRRCFSRTCSSWKRPHKQQRCQQPIIILFQNQNGTKMPCHLR